MPLSTMSENENTTTTEVSGGGAGESAAVVNAVGPETGPGVEADGETNARWATLQEQASKAKENWERYVRTAADFENYKKRAARERQEASRYAQEALLGKLIPVLDNFEMALAAVDSAGGGTVESLRTGVAMIHGQLKAVLTEVGLEAVEALGQAFDPNRHEAVAQAESAEVPEGQVLHQLRRGYRFQDRLLRPASVVVAKRPAEPGFVATAPPGSGEGS
jgi:molecular chaperone GrpE